jgi:hypothetical protein
MGIMFFFKCPFFFFFLDTQKVPTRYHEKKKDKKLMDFADVVDCKLYRNWAHACASHGPYFNNANSLRLYLPLKYPKEN